MNLKYENIARLRIANEIFSIYDENLNNKYNVEVNGKGITKVKNSFNEANLLKKFRENHKKKKLNNFSKHKCNRYFSVENLYRYLLNEKDSFIFESVEKGKIRGRYTIIGLRPDKTYDIKKSNNSD